MIPLALALCLAQSGETEGLVRVEEAIPAYALLRVPAEAVAGREFPVRVVLYDAAGETWHGRLPDPIRFALEDGTGGREEVPAARVRGEGARWEVRVDSPGFYRLSAYVGAQLLGRSLMFRVADARPQIQVELPERAYAGESLPMDVRLTDASGRPWPVASGEGWAWRVDTEGVRVELEGVEAGADAERVVRIWVVPLETGALRLRVRELTNDWRGTSALCVILPPRMKRLAVRLPPVVRAGELVLAQAEPVGGRGLPAAPSPELKGVRWVFEDGSAPVPPRFHEGLWAGRAYEGWMMFPVSGRQRLRAVMDTTPAPPAVYAVLRRGAGVFEFVGDAPADGVRVESDTSGAVRVVWPGAVWRGGRRRVVLGESEWWMETGPPMVARLAGRHEVLRRAADRNTFRLDVAPRMEENTPPVSDWRALIQAGRYGEAAARLREHLAARPDDTAAKEVLKRLMRIEEILHE